MSLYTTRDYQQRGVHPVTLLPFLDSAGQENSLPAEIAYLIFQNLKKDLPTVALVCKDWKTLTDDEEFRKMICPFQAFGTQEWQEYIGVDAGKEPRLPRRAYGDLEKEGGMLTYIPGKVRVTRPTGETEEILFDNLNVIGELVKNPIKGFKTGYSDPLSHQEHPSLDAILEKRKVEEPHWVWINTKLKGQRESYDEQLNLAREENTTAPGAEMSRLIDTVVSLFMERVRRGVCLLPWDPCDSHTAWVRVQDKSGEYATSVYYGKTGLVVLQISVSPCGYIAFVVARRAF